LKLQFSLATLLVCTTVLAVVCAVAVKMPVYVERQSTSFIRKTTLPNGITTATFKDSFSLNRPPDGIDIAWRLAIWGPLAIAGTLAGLWIVRRLKSRHEIEQLSRYTRRDSNPQPSVPKTDALSN
jgi:hypothetical protein